MIRYQDIQIPDKELRDRFVSYILSGDYQAAFDIIEDNPNLDYKAFVAQVINENAEMMHDMETDIDDGVNGYLASLSANFNELINQFLNKRNWSNTVTYELYNFVIYNNSVYMYINENASIGIVPTNTAYWAEFGLKGAKGAGGSDLSLQFYWMPNVQYYAYDLVMTTGRMWVAKAPSVGQQPQEGSAYWEEFAYVTDAQIYTTTTAPDTRYIGQIWMETV